MTIDDRAFPRGPDGRSTDHPFGSGPPEWLAASLNHCTLCGGRLELGVGRVPLLVRDGLGGRVEEGTQRADLLVGRGLDRDVGGMRLEGEPDVVALEEGAACDGVDEVPAARLHR